MVDISSKKIGIVDGNNTIISIYDFEEFSTVLLEGEVERDAKRFMNYIIGEVKKVLDLGHFESYVFSFTEESGFHINGALSDIQIGDKVKILLRN